MDINVTGEQDKAKISKEQIFAAINHGIAALSHAQEVAVSFENMRERTPEHYSLDELDCVELLMRVEDELELEIELYDEYANFGVLYDAIVASACTRPTEE